MMRLLGIKAIRFLPKIKGEHLTLRLLCMRDLFILRSAFRPARLLEVHGEPIESFGSLLSLWKWLRSAFQIVYVIEMKRTPGHCTVGMVGLYDLDMGSSAFLSAVLFDPRDHGQGYGRESVRLFVDFLKMARVAKEVYVEVMRGNLMSLTFFRNMGFEIQTAHSDCLLLSKKLDKDNGFANYLSKG